MADIGAIVLHKLLQEKSLEGWSRIKLAFLDSYYSSIYTIINKYYNKYSCIPGFDELELFSRDTPLSRAIFSLKELEVPDDIDLEFAIDTLIDSYTQSETLKLIDRFVDNITLMNAQEIKDSVSDIVLKLDEKTHTSETIVKMDNIILFEEEDKSAHKRFPLGLNNSFDSTLGGGYREELILLGGKRGAGKSIVCNNLITNQYEQGNAAVYFTIEMTAKETLERTMSILSNVDHVKLKQNSLSQEEYMRVAKVRADMFLESSDLYKEYLDHLDIRKLEKDLIRTKFLKTDNQIVVIDDRELSIISIDLHLQKLKAQFGDKLTVAAVDYINQVVIPGQESRMYDWTNQIFIAKKLKEYARKYDILIVAPFQIDDTGATRFAKGILDAADVAINLDAHEKEDSAISFNMTKIRGGPPIDVTSGIDWGTLRIHPHDVVPPKAKSKTKEKAEEHTPTTEKSGDLPWNN